jgi:hypothetical protein
VAFPADTFLKQAVVRGADSPIDLEPSRVVERVRASGAGQVDLFENQEIRNEKKEWLPAKHAKGAKDSEMRG